MCSTFIRNEQLRLALQAHHLECSILLLFDPASPWLRDRGCAILSMYWARHIWGQFDDMR